MTRPTRPDEAPARPDQRWLILGIAALVVGRPCLTSEGVAQGEGLLWVMLWLTLLVAWAAWGWARQSLWLRWQLPETMLAAVTAWYLLAAWSGSHEGNTRAAINLSFEWLGLAASFFLIRQLIEPPRLTACLLVGMIGLAGLIGTDAVWEYYVEKPRDRRAFEEAKDQEALVRASGLRITRDSPSWGHFVQRLYSDESQATFGLANSLGGWLVPWLVLGCGLFAIWRRGPSRGEPRRWAVGVLLAVLVLLMAVGLWFTQSRTGLLATLCGLGLWATSSFWRTWSPRAWLLGGAAALGLAVALVLALAFTPLGDRFWNSGPGLSLWYRIQYWQGSTELVLERPLLGVGPGQFQSHYTRFKDETASEEVADPHNFLVEMATLSGLPGALLLLGFLASVAWGAWGRSSTSPRGPPPADSSTTTSLLYGVVIGIPLAWVVGLVSGEHLDFIKILIGTLALAGILAVLARWATNLDMPTALVGVAAVAFGINLLSAGGLTFTAVAQAGVILLAVVLNQAGPSPVVRLDQRWALVVLALAIGLFAACHWLAYGPVSASRGLVQAALQAEHWDDRYQLLEAAAEADPRDALPPQALASGLVELWSPSWGDDGLKRVDRWAARFREASGESDLTHYQMALWFEQLAKKTQKNSYAQRADEAYRASLAWYPRNGLRWAQWSDFLAEQSEEAQAVTAAREALRLHERTPHRDKKLPSELHERLQRRVEAGSPPLSAPEPPAD